jgi:hypothetical protein
MTPLPNRQHVTRFLLAAGGLMLSATAVAIGFVGVALNKPATLMSPNDYEAAKSVLDIEVRTALDRCLSHDGAIFDVCRAEAQAQQRTKRAQLEADYLGTAEAAHSARQVEADAAYDLATAKCDDGRESRARLTCLKTARAERVKQLL